jgi:hypothetical protein
MKLLAFALVLALAATSFAQASICDDAYNACISECCSDCGSTLSTDSYGDLVCDVGTQANPKQDCIDMCTTCSTQYQDCMAIYGGSTDSSDTSGSSSPGASCCGSSAILLAIGCVAFAAKR